MEPLLREAAVVNSFGARCLVNSAWKVRDQVEGFRNKCIRYWVLTWFTVAFRPDVSVNQRRSVRFHLELESFLIPTCMCMSFHAQHKYETRAGTLREFTVAGVCS